MFVQITGGKKFSEVGLTQACLQLSLDQKSKEYMTINTQRGLFRFCRMPFGVASASAIFQRTVESILQDIPFVVVVRADDILVSGIDDADHLANLKNVLFVWRQLDCGPSV